MNKKAAAEFLNVSPRAIERYTARGLISVTYIKGNRGNIADYNPEELAKLRSESSQESIKPKTSSRTPASKVSKIPPPITDIQFPPTPVAAQNLATVIAAATPIVSQILGKNIIDIGRSITNRVDRLISALEALKPREDSQPSLTDLSAKMLLSIPEAAALSGLSEHFLIAAIKKKQLTTLKTEDKLYVKRQNLEKFIAKL